MSDLPVITDEIRNARLTYERRLDMINREFREGEARIIKKYMDCEYESVQDVHEDLSNLDSNTDDLRQLIAEMRDAAIEDEEEGRNHEDFTECYKASTELKVCGKESKFYQQSIDTIVHSDLPMQGKRSLLFRGCLDEDEIDKLLNSKEELKSNGHY